MYVKLKLWFVGQENKKRTSVLGMIKKVEVMDEISYLGGNPCMFRSVK